MPIGEYYRTADWKKEKHAPVIESPDMVNIGEEFVVSLIIGKKIPIMASRYDFLGYGASVKEDNEGSLYTEPKVQTTIKFKDAGTLIATSYCNIHGLWESGKEIKVA